MSGHPSTWEAEAKAQRARAEAAEARAEVALAGLRAVKNREEKAVLMYENKLTAIETKKDLLTEALESIYEISVEPAETNDNHVRRWIEVRARAAIKDAQEEHSYD